MVQPKRKRPPKKREEKEASSFKSWESEEWCLCPDPFSASDRRAHPSFDSFSSFSAILQNSRFINHHCRKVIGGT
ncbi:hypothetical protein PanWU01x14_026970 [Parasponia andersonii]|uniref:Uncharacterized protein n=1 Tax=Parasponia andersonii TaxID=3476 RepID=A0A2P5DW82_PARAD|nr:hypothetical protein PanWU01x14_026970 [Parasponia andersonii]